MILSKVIRILSCVCVLSFWGCGGGSDSSETSTESSTTETASTPESTPSNDSASGGGSPSPEMAMGGEGMMDLGAGGGAGGDSSGGMSEEMMQMEIAGGFGPDGAEGGYPGGSGAPQKPPRPEKISDWTPEQVGEAISESDVKAITAIQAFANKNRGKAVAVGQLSTWITALTTESTGNSGGEGGYAGGLGGAGGADAQMMQEFGGGGGGMQGGGQGGGAKQKIAQALLAALATTGTPNAYGVIRNVLKGDVDLGVDQEKATAWAMTTLIKSISDPNSPGRGLLWASFTSNPPTGSAAEKGESVVSLHQRAKELHLGFAIAAMNGLIGASGPPPKANGTQYGGMGGMEDSMMGGGDFGGAGMDPSFGGGGFGQPGGGQQQQTQPSALPVKITPVFLNKEDAEASLTYIWSEEMTQFVAAQLKFDMNSADYLVFAGALPTVVTRNAVQAALNLHKNQPPSSWVHPSVFSKQLADPAVHVYVKSLPREQPAEAANKGGGGVGGAGAYPGGEGGDLGSSPARSNRRSRSRSRKKEKTPDPQAEARKEARYGWMKASEETLLSLMERMYQGTMQPGATPYQAADLPFQLHRGAEVTASLRFALPGEANESDELRSAQQTLVSYVRIESKLMSQKTVQHYRSVVRDEEVVTILGGKGMWLDGGVKPNKKDGMLRSVDVLLSKGNSRPSLKRNRGQRQAQSDGFSAEAGFGGDGYPGGGGQGGGGGESFVVELLIVEVPDTATKAEEAEVSSTTK